MGCCSIGGVDTSRGYNMEKGYNGGQTPGERRVRSGIISKTSHEVFACLFLPKLWFSTQIFPTPKENKRRLLTTISWKLWTGANFRVP